MTYLLMVGLGAGEWRLGIGENDVDKGEIRDFQLKNIQILIVNIEFPRRIKF